MLCKPYFLCLHAIALFEQEHPNYYELIFMFVFAAKGRL